MNGEWGWAEGRRSLDTRKWMNWKLFDELLEARRVD
jgi:hypothetical protein